MVQQLMVFLFISVILLVDFTAAATNATDVSALWKAGRYGLAPTLEIEKFWTRDVPQSASPEYHLEYMALRGRAELPMLVLEVANMPYLATFYSKDDFAEKAKAKQPLGRLPALTPLTSASSGRKIFQSAAIVRFLGYVNSLDGNGDLEWRARVDAMFETVNELPLDASALKSGRGSNRLLDYKDTSNRGDYTDYEKSAATLVTFERFLEERATGFLTGDRLTYADLALWYKLSELSEEDQFPDWHKEVSVPRLKQFHDDIESLVEVQRYMKSKRRLPRVARKEVDGVADFYYKTGKWSTPEQHAEIREEL